MNKKIFFILLSLAFLAGCEDSPQIDPIMANFYARYDNISKLQENNDKYAINGFLRGKWEGKCANVDADKVLIEFDKYSRVFVYNFPAEPTGRLTQSGGVYEVTSEKTLSNLFSKDAPPSIEVEKIGDNQVKFSGGIVPDCVFTRANN